MDKEAFMERLSSILLDEFDDSDRLDELIDAIHELTDAITGMKTERVIHEYHYYYNNSYNPPYTVTYSTPTVFSNDASYDSGSTSKTTMNTSCGCCNSGTEDPDILRNHLTFNVKHNVLPGEEE